jgi:hypothetical protein
VTIGSLQTTSAVVTAEGVFSIYVDLGLVNSAPMLVTRSSDLSISADGEVSFTFDRDVQANMDAASGVAVAITDFGVNDQGVNCNSGDVGGVLGVPPIMITTTTNKSIVKPRWTTAPVTSGCKGVIVTFTWNNFGYITLNSTIGKSTQIGGSTQIYLTSPGQ